MNKRKIIIGLISTCCILFLVLGYQKHQTKRQMIEIATRANQKTPLTGQFVKTINGIVLNTSFKSNIGGEFQSKPLRYDCHFDSAIGKDKQSGNVYIEGNQRYLNLGHKWTKAKMVNMSPNDYKRPLQILNNKDFKPSIKYGIDAHNDINAKITLNKSQRQKLLKLMQRDEINNQFDQTSFKDTKLTKVVVGEVIDSKTKLVHHIEETIDVSTKLIDYKITLNLNNLNYQPHVNVINKPTWIKQKAAR